MISFPYFLIMPDLEIRLGNFSFFNNTGTSDNVAHYCHFQILDFQVVTEQHSLWAIHTLVFSLAGACAFYVFILDKVNTWAGSVFLKHKAFLTSSCSLWSFEIHLTVVFFLASRQLSEIFLKRLRTIEGFFFNGTVFVQFRLGMVVE